MESKRFMQIPKVKPTNNVVVSVRLFIVFYCYFDAVVYLFFAVFFSAHKFNTVNEWERSSEKSGIKSQL